nr:MAG TPA: hypothetical protein [Crassvirales sp.]
MSDVKVSLTVALQGRTMLSQETADALEKLSPASGYDKTSIEVSGPDHKDREVIVIKTRKSIPATQTINLSEEAYNYMTSSESCPFFLKQRHWNALKTKERLAIHIERIAQQLGGVVLSCQVLED